MIKSKSIDSVKNTDEVIRIEINKLREHFDVKELINLEPFHSDHVAVISQKES